MSDELKSAWELAQEKLEKLEKLEQAEPGGAARALTKAQKQRIAEVRADAKAQRAELEVLNASRMRDARSKGDAESLLRLEEERVLALRGIDEREQERVAAIRAGTEG
jgi:hypothetical protein